MSLELRVLRLHKEKCAQHAEMDALVQEWGRQVTAFSSDSNSSSVSFSGAWSTIYTIAQENLIPKQFARKTILPNTTFHVYQDLPMDYSCSNLENQGQLLESCKKVKQFMEYMLSKQEDTQSPDLYIIPMDYLAMQVTSSPNNSNSTMAVVDKITRGLRYIHFGGSNHIFLCLSDGCGVVMQEIVSRCGMPQFSEEGSMIAFSNVSLCCSSSAPE